MDRSRWLYCREETIVESLTSIDYVNNTGNAKKVADFPELQMKSDGDGVFIISFIPQYFFKLSENQSIESMQFTITRPNLVNSDDVVDEVSIFFINANVCR